MNMQFGFGGFNPYTGMGGMTQGMGGFNPFGGMGQGFSGYNPYSMMYGGMGGNFNPFMGMYGGFPMLNPMQFFQDYLTQMQEAQTPLGEQVKVPESTPTQEAPSAETGTEASGGTGTTLPTPPMFNDKFGISALKGGQFSKGGVQQLKQAGIVQNKQQANQMLKDFQTTNAGQNVTQQQFQDYAKAYQAPAPAAPTFAMPAPKVVANNPNNLKTKRAM
jgi:hypothetical protein